MSKLSHVTFLEPILTDKRFTLNEKILYGIITECDKNNTTVEHISINKIGIKSVAELINKSDKWVWKIVKKLEKYGYVYHVSDDPVYHTIDAQKEKHENKKD